MNQLNENGAGKISDLASLLRFKAKTQPDKTGYIFLKNGEKEESSITYSQLDAKAMAIAENLLINCRKNDRVLLLYPSGIDYIAAFFGCIYAGCIAVPVYPPQPARMDRTLPRLLSIVSNAWPSAVLTTSKFFRMKDKMLMFDQSFDRMKWLVSDDMKEPAAPDWKGPLIEPDMIAFLQYTSGSTGNPKGVMISHSNLMHNQEVIKAGFESRESSVAVGWLPLYHDMGLIGNIMHSLYRSIKIVFMSPMSFLQKPSRWLNAISKYSAAFSGGPNFAYDLCVQRVSSDQKKELDLKCWDTAFSGSEPVRFETIERFSKAFECCGFTRKAFFPCYGLAEATLMVSGNRKEEPIIKSFDLKALNEKRMIVSCEKTTESTNLAGAGRPVKGQLVKIVDPETFEVCKSGEIGEIWISGQSVAGGYWKNPDETRKMFQVRPKEYKNIEPGRTFFRTGDLGAFYDEELFITGRIKDMIIIRGKNHYPQDIEKTVEKSFPLIRPGSCAAFSVEHKNNERLVVVAEIERRHIEHKKPASDGRRRRKPKNLRNFKILPEYDHEDNLPFSAEDALNAVRAAVSKRHDLQVWALMLIKVGTIPKTTSGKIRRNACKSEFFNKEFNLVASSIIADKLSDEDIKLPGKKELMGVSFETGKKLLGTGLINLAAKILKIDPSTIRKENHLTGLGIDSLQAVEFQHFIESEYSMKVPMIKFLQGLSIEQLSGEICLGLDESHNDSVVTAETGASKPFTSYPLSHNQRSLWFMHKLDPRGSAYNVSFAVRIKNNPDTRILKKCFKVLAMRHPSLRTEYKEQDNGPIQVINDDPDIYFEIEDAYFSGPKELNNHLSKKAHIAFDLENGPIFRVNLFKLDEKQIILLFCVHHIAIDFWSINILMAELGILYEAELKEEGSGPGLLNFAGMSCADYARFQTERLAGIEGERLRTYWKNMLGNDIPVLDLPTDHKRPTVQTYNGASHGFALDGYMAHMVEKLAKNTDTTQYMVLLSAFHILLHRLSGQTDILTGSPAAGRTHASFFETVGYLANPVVIRSDCSENPKFSAYLEQIRKKVIGALDHQDYPFQLLVEELNLRRDPSRTPLFQVMFVLEKPHLIKESAPFILNEPGANFKLGSLILESKAINNRASQFDLTLIMVRTETGFRASIEYNTDIFEKKSIVRMAGHYINILKSIVDDPNSKISNLNMLSPGEKRLVIQGFNETKARYSLSKSVVQLFEDEVEKTPERTATVFQGKKTSYLELNRHANRIASFLLNHFQIKPGEIIGSVLDRSDMTVAGMLGIMKAGGAYTPVDMSYPPERIRYMIEDSGLRVVIVDRAGKTLLDSLDLDCKTVDITTIHENVDNPCLNIAAQDLSYVLYTSGSTGKPKAVMQTHKCLSNLVQWQTRAIGREFRILQYAALGFDVSIQETLYSLVSGSTLFIIPNSLRYDMAGLSAFIRKNRINLFTMPFSPMNLLFKEGRTITDNPYLRHIVTSGEALKIFPELADYLLRHPNVRLHNQYGPTETHVITAHTISSELGNIKTYPPIGKPIANTEIYILDEYFNPCPVGVVGEIYASGANLARGYLNKESMTAEKFISGVAPVESKRIYRTGDMGRWLDDGMIEFLGRNDDQVKIRGNRVELQEIENRLLQHPAIKNTVVIAGEFKEGQTEIAAYIILSKKNEKSENPEKNDDITDLRNHLKKSLPDYMIPSYFVFLESFSLTPNGKVNKKDLPDPLKAGVHTQKTQAGPENDIHEKLIDIWIKILPVDSIGITEDFFQCGGHSLTAIQLISRIHKNFGVKMAVSAIFAGPTIAEMAKKIQNTQPSEYERIIPEPENPDSGQRNTWPLSNAQSRLFILHQIAGGHIAYNMPGAMKIKGDFNQTTLIHAFTELIKRHQSLRTVFVIENGVPCQRITPPPENLIDAGIIRIIDLPDDLDLDNDLDLEKKSKELILKDANTPFDLETGPLVRITLVKVTADRKKVTTDRKKAANDRKEEKSSGNIMIINMHHIISDGTSLNVMVNEFSLLYQAFSRGEKNPLSPLSIQYKDYTMWQNRMIETGVFSDHQQYWHKKLAGEIPVLNLPADFQRPSVHKFNGKILSSRLPEELTGQLKTLASNEGASLFMALISMIKILAYRYTGQEDIIIGTPVAGRNHEDLENQIGFYVNTLPLRDHIDPDAGFTDLLKQVQETITMAVEYQSYPFDKLVDELNLNRDLSRSPLFDVMAVLQEDPRPCLKIEKLLLEPIKTEYESSKFDLSFMFFEKEGYLICDIEYNTSLFARERISRMTGHFQTLARSILKHPYRPVKKLDILTLEERTKLVHEFNYTEADYPKNSNIVELFRKKAFSAPDNNAVVSGGKTLTFRQLNDKAVSVAAFLIEQYDVGNDERVGLLTDRSDGLIIGALSILMAGAAYVPIDPSYPDNRIDFIVKDSGCKLVLTSTKYIREKNISEEEIPFVEIESIPGKKALAEMPDFLTPKPEDLAYVIYTSGSTGQPKGVAIEHRSLINLVSWHARAFEVTSESRATMYASTGFDASVWELWPYLLNGAALYPLDEEIKLDSDELCNFFIKNHISHAFLPSPVCDALIMKNPGGMETMKILTGGDVLKNKPGENLCVINNYGPTEFTVVAASAEVDHLSAGTVSIGKPIHNTTIDILDKNMELVPVGIKGEICISGAGLAREYLNLPDLTKKSFISHPFRKKSRMYRTGDMGQWRSDGMIDFMGRNDHQVKIRGYRIETGEVENSMKQHPLIKDAVVLSMKIRGNEKELAAYFTIRKKKQGDSSIVDSLRKFLESRLPAFMIPSWFFEMDEFPLTSSEKIDRKSLPVPERKSRNYQDTIAEILSDTEKVLIEIFEEVLMIEKAGLHENIFDMGGNSLILIKIKDLIKKKLGCQILMVDMFRYPTAGMLAGHIDSSNINSSNIGSNKISSQDDSNKADSGHTNSVKKANMRSTRKRKSEKRRSARSKGRKKETITIPQGH
ncbi:amino acid adenylation domain-containing protein [Desulfobacterales bacterium HSG16]|nr:amino acid adenylation domain-containing protein [Desulfobacterales bacterium HSG16]